MIFPLPLKLGTSHRGQIAISGVDEVDANLQALPDAFRSQVSETILIAAQIILAEAESRAPVGETGALKESLEADISEDGLSATVGTNLLYAKFVELGTKHQRPQPFLWPAFQLGARFVRKEMRDWAAESVKKLRFKTKRGRRAKGAKKVAKAAA